MTRKIETTLEGLALELRDLKGQKKAVEVAISSTQTDLIEALDETNLQTQDVAVPDSDIEVTVTVVRGTNVVINYDAIAEQVTPRVLKQISRMVIDPDALEDAVAQGIVPAALVSANTSLKPKAPYIKMTERKVR